MEKFNIGPEHVKFMGHETKIFDGLEMAVAHHNEGVRRINANLYTALDAARETARKEYTDLCAKTLENIRALGEIK